MEIKKSAVAGTLESSDVQIMLSAGNNGIEFELVSDVAKQFGDAIKETITMLNTKSPSRKWWWNEIVMPSQTVFETTSSIESIILSSPVVARTLGATRSITG